LPALVNLDRGGTAARRGRDDRSVVRVGSSATRCTRNNPAFVDATFVYEVDRLPLEGQTKIAPTPADYWPTYKDSVNVRWDGDELSPAEKYEKAFDKPGLALDLSRLSGIRAQTHRKECEKTEECSDLKDGSQCAIPRGETKGRCIPTWWGICPGWSAASYMELPPRRPVTRNGVTFYPGDLEALMALAYDRSRKPVKFIGGRCNLEDLPTDETGRVTAPECRDLNAGALHVIVANKLGLRHEGFVVERTASLQV
jgi:hypothetical protein